jgi:Xaa-Pro aminopeptidase
MPLSVKQRLAALRALMKQHDLDAYFVPSVDPHGSEYVPDCWQRRAFISGFTGSAGDVVVTTKGAALWTDGRYFIQGARQLQGSGIKLMKMGQPKVLGLDAWLSANLQSGQLLGADPRVLSKTVAARLAAAAERAGAKLKLVDQNLVDQVWGDERPALPEAPVAVHPPRYAGESVKSKLKRLRKELSTAKADALVISTLDAVAWTFNVRGADVDYNPLVIAYGLVTPDEATLYCDPTKVSEKVRATLQKAGVAIGPYEGLGKALSALNRVRATVWVDPSTVNAWVLSKLRRAKLKEAASPIVRIKARKNAKEIAGARAAHIRDGAAMVRFFAWLEGALATPRGKRAATASSISEIDASTKLREFRAEGEQFRFESFSPISGYAGNGAIVHYSAEPETASTLKAQGIYLIDSGGQYLDGTTDITRTVLLGAKATAQQKSDFTRVLKGHIAISQLRFPVGTPGRNIDAFARKALWDVCLDYAHGTGHGVGAYLGVHEGPQAISPTRCTGAPLEPGNILSNEPGFYREGEYGIRIENLVLVVEDEQSKGKDGKGPARFLCFDNLTVCPIDTKLVDVKLLTKEERSWLNGYHKMVRETLSPLVTGKARAWLKSATKAI